MHRSTERKPAPRAGRVLRSSLLGVLIASFLWSIAWPLARGRSPFTWGLDLSGGVRVVYRPDFASLEHGGATVDRAAALAQAKEVLASRLARGLAIVPDVVMRSDQRIVVSLPGDRDQMGALTLVGKTYRLTWRLVAPGGVVDGGIVTGDAERFTHQGRPLLLEPAHFAGDMLDAHGIGVAAADPGSLDPGARSARITFRFRAPHDAAFEAFTRANTGRSLAILIDDEVEWVGTIGGPIAGAGVLAGSYSFDEATAIARVLRAGTLPVALAVEDVETVGPSLGHALRVQGGRAIAWAGAALLALLALAYGHRGDRFAAASLSAVCLVGVIATLVAVCGLTVDLAALAGLVLSVGMGLDAFLLVLEALERESLESGAAAGPASRRQWIRRVYAFGREGGILFHANATTLLVVSLLLGAERLRSFALFMIVGIAASLATIVFTRALLERLPVGWRGGPGFVGFLRSARPRMLRFRGLWLAVLLVVLAAPAFLPAARLEPGADFRAGTQLQVQADAPERLESLRASLAERWPGASPRVQRLGEDGRRFLVDLGLTVGDGSLEASAEALRAEASAAGVEVESLRTVDARVSAERVASSLGVLVVSVILLGIYLVGVEGPINRFFGLRVPRRSGQGIVFLGIVGAVVLDVAVAVAVLAALAIPIGLPVVAALLTVVGYSVNDSVVLWGHVRRCHADAGAAGASPWETVAAAVDDVASRTVLTSVSTAVPALALLAVGLEPLRGFAWTILVGTVAGTLSSIFVVGTCAVWALGRRAGAAAALVPRRETA